MELVQRVTGHRTVEVVLKHYFRPGREDFRKAISSAMPKLLMNGEHPSPKDEMRRIIEGMTAGSLPNDRKQLLQLLKSM